MSKACIVGLGCVWAACLASACLWPVEDASSASTGAAMAAEVADLQEQLEDGLKARLPREFAFIDRVVALVREGRLPLDLVKGTFQWARSKRPYPFPYFERGLRLRAAKLGITL
jgi:hypothetical protein